MNTKRAPLEHETSPSIENIENALAYISPVNLDYDAWLRIGMALKSAGCMLKTWETWSSQDPGRFHDGECEKKWNSFNGDGVGIGTLFFLAKQGGWSPKHNSIDCRDLPDCEDSIHATSAEPETPENQLSIYLHSVFEPGDQIRIVGDAYIGKDGRLRPTKGITRSREEWMEKLKTGGVDALGPFNEHGGWCAVNPVDGKDIKAVNVTRFKHTLIESDDLPIAEQKRLIGKLNLPVTTLTHSAGKSLHALVRTDAGNRKEYDERVKRLHDTCNEAGLIVDPACKDPGRLTRLPGVKRGDALQRLVAANISAASWDAWIALQSCPLICTTARELLENPPPPDPILIHGLVHQGGIMCISGQSKAGKSSALIQTALALAGGGMLFGHFQCEAVPLLLIAIEGTVRQQYERLKASLGFQQFRGWLPQDDAFLDRLHLATLPMNAILDANGIKQFARTHRRAHGPVGAFIVDPIYLIDPLNETRDENSAADTTRLIKNLAMAAAELDASLVYSHHYSKGNKSMVDFWDRASGSGVHARMAACISGLTPLECGNGAVLFEAKTRGFRQPDPVPMRFTWPCFEVDTTLSIRLKGTPGRKPAADASPDALIPIIRMLGATNDDGQTQTHISEMALHMGITEKTVRRRCSQAAITIKNGFAIVPGECENTEEDDEEVPF